MKIFLRHLIPVVVGIALTLILTWPFPAKLSTYYKDSGDYAFDGSMLYYNQEAIRTGKILDRDEYFKGYQFYPQPDTIAYSDHLIIPSIIFSPIYWLTDNFIFSVNLLALTSFFLSFLVSFYVINAFIKHTAASLVGAAIYAFNPQMFTRFPYHLGLLGHYFIPLVFIFTYRFLSRPNFKNTFLLGLSFTVNTLTAVYFQILSILFLPIFSAPFLIFYMFKKKAGYIFDLLKCLPVFLIFLPILFFINVPYLEFSKNEGAVRTLEQTLFHSGRLINWLFANPDSLVYGNFVKQFESIRSPGPDLGSPGFNLDGKFNYSEHTLFLNVLPIILAVTGTFVLIRKKKTRDDEVWVVAAFLLVLGAAFVLSFGPIFFGWNGEGPYIKLPFYYLYQVLPILKGIRVPNRLQFILYVPFSMLASYGAYYFLTKTKKKSVVYCLAALFIAVIVLENIHLRTYNNRSEFLVGQVNQDLRFIKDTNVLHIPIHIPELGETSTYSLGWYVLTGARSINGYSGFVSPDQLKFLIGLKNNPGEDMIRKLSVIKTDYILIHDNLLGEEAEKYAEFQDLYNQGEIYSDNNIRVIDLKRYDFKTPVCNFDNDIEKKLQLITADDLSNQYYALFLKNTSNCYYPSLGKEKYKTATLGISSQQTRKFHLRMPVVIEPFGEYVLSEPARSLRME